MYAIQATIQAVVPILLNGNGYVGAQAGAGGGGASGDPFEKRLKAFIDVGMTKLTGDEDLITGFIWIVDAQCMVAIVDSVPTERAHRKPVSPQMIDNTLTWW